MEPVSVNRNGPGNRRARFTRPRSVWVFSPLRGVASTVVYAAPQQHSNRRWRLDAVLAPGLHRRTQATSEAQTMDGTHFDALTRSLTVAGSRRRALAAALGSALGLLGWHGVEHTAAHDPSKGCKRKSGKAKKKCLKKAKAHNAAHANETAPPAGCPSGTQACGGECLKPCTGFTSRNPFTCKCCGITGKPCTLGSECCNNFCTAIAPLVCEGNASGQPCDFDAQCFNGNCGNGFCV
jgi:hypothetical protein